MHLQFLNHKAKALLEEAYDRYGEPEEKQETRKRPRTRGLKRALELEKQNEAELANELTWNEKFAILVNENREHWLDKVNQHIEKLLDKANKQNKIQKKMAKHYANRERIAREKLKDAKERIEALTHQKEKEKLDILGEASLQAYLHQTSVP